MSRTCTPSTYTHMSSLNVRVRFQFDATGRKIVKEKGKKNVSKRCRDNIIYWTYDRQKKNTHTWNERESCAGNERSLWIMQRTRAYFEQHQHRAHTCTHNHVLSVQLDTCICIWKPFKRGWLKPLLLRRIMTTKILHIISLNGQSTWDWTMLASSSWHIAHATAHSLCFSLFRTTTENLHDKKCKFEETVIRFLFSLEHPWYWHL